jgi:hypothetical protein
MDIYGLKNDATGAMYDARSCKDHHPKSSKHYKYHAQAERAYEQLMYICEGWMGKETPTQYLQDEIFELSEYQARRVRWAIKELGYRLPGMHRRSY